MTMEVFFMGLQQQGASLALAMADAGIEATHVGYDADQEAARALQKAGALDRLVLNPYKAARTTDVIVLSGDSSQADEFLRAVVDDLKDGVTILDCTALKAAIASWAADRQRSIAYVGLVPVLPVEALHDLDSSYARARGDLFRDSPMGIVLPPNLPQETSSFAVGLVEAIGGQPFFIDAAELDALTSMGEDVPATFATALLASAAQSVAWPSLERIAGRALVAATQPLASGEAADLSARLLANRHSLGIHLREIIEKLEELRQAIEREDESALTTQIERAIEARRKWLAKRARADWRSEELGQTDPPASTPWGRIIDVARGRGQQPD